MRIDNIFVTLATHGADVNIVYPENTHKPAFTEEDAEDESYDPKATYKCTPLINLIRQNAKFKEIMRDNVMGLIQYGAKFNILDSDGRDPLTYAVISNNQALIRMMIDNKMQGQLSLTTRD